MRYKIFNNEISFIKNEKIKEFIKEAINELPDYFFEVSASSTSRYHPKYALGEGGLVRHTKAAVIIADALLNLEMYGKFTQDEKDLMIVSLILHDGKKCGEIKSDYTVADHPLVVANWIKNNEKLNNMLPVEQIDFVCEVIKSHMGQWDSDFKTKKVILPRPKTSAQKFVHQCDYLASRKYLEMDFGDNYYNPKDFIDNGLDELIKTIVGLCKDVIAKGIDKEEVYSIIAENNGNKKNPNAITSVDVAEKIIKLLEEKMNG